MGLTVGIIGGNGRMGSWFGKLLEAQGHRVLCADRQSAVTPAAMVPQCQVVVISVPIAATLAVIAEVAPLLPPDAVLMDLTSIKKEPLEAMLRLATCEVVGLHPLLGPEAPAGCRGRVVICRGRGERGLRWVCDLLRASGLEPVFMEAEEHDFLMGMIQGATHFATMALALCIMRSGVPISTLHDSATENFRATLERIATMAAQPSHLFYSLISDNPAAISFVHRFLEGARELHELVAEGSGEDFSRLFTEMRNFFCTAPPAGDIDNRRLYLAASEETT